MFFLDATIGNNFSRLFHLSVQTMIIDEPSEKSSAGIRDYKPLLNLTGLLSLLAIFPSYQDLEVALFVAVLSVRMMGRFLESGSPGQFLTRVTTPTSHRAAVLGFHTSNQGFPPRIGS